MMTGLGGSELKVQGSATPLVYKAASLIGKGTNERPTSNIERPTSNKVFCQFIIVLNKANQSNKNQLFLDQVISVIRSVLK